MASSSTITDKQLMILNFIKKEIAEKGYPPSVREICQGVGLSSTSTVHGHLERLEKKGYIRRDPTKPRAIEILHRDDNPVHESEVISVPILGKVAAGMPILAFENKENRFPIPAEYFKNKNDMFMLQIQGDSMVECGILDGDYVIVEKRNTAENGEIVAALLEDSATVKRFFKEKNHIRLQPENSSMEPIITKECTILGIVIGLFRVMK
ncbi:MAG TPA: repressor LexA [Clostridiaceae bacterium]|jgi:repressor LexA|nr:repressor LexA [Clostridiaceae bacterium]HBX48872.1 repressor LexA [Clostridiaceae bacterium]HCL51061.1 repressor LexA [Clostridiaceae bacterium]